MKKYNGKATDNILNALKSTVQNHCRKQVQMHSVARHIASKFKRSPPSTFGQCFTYNRCYYTSFDGQPATIEEYVPGDFTKYINNNGVCFTVPEDASQVLKDLYEKSWLTENVWLTIVMLLQTTSLCCLISKDLSRHCMIQKLPLEKFWMQMAKKCTSAVAIFQPLQLKYFCQTTNAINIVT